MRQINIKADTNEKFGICLFLFYNIYHKHVIFIVKKEIKKSNSSYSAKKFIPLHLIFNKFFMDIPQTHKKRRAFHYAFHTSIPIMAGYGFLGLTYGIYMHEQGFNFLYPMLLAITVYAGSAEFLIGNILLGSFQPLQTFFLVLMVNARHLFYGLSMLDKYKGLGWKKFFLIFGMSDETFALTNTTSIPKGVDRGWFLLWVTWLDETYWVIGATLGGLIGPLLTFDLSGLDFVLTAMFTAIFTDNWIREKNHTSSVSGVIICGLCLIIFGADKFIIPSMTVILVFLILMRKKLAQATNKI